MLLLLFHLCFHTENATHEVRNFSIFRGKTKIASKHLFLFSLFNHVLFMRITTFIQLRLGFDVPK